jgi:predicted DNA-binding protein (MmcQ/YjbR family)
VTHKEFHEFMLSLPKVWLDYPFGEDAAVYKFGDKPEGKIAAIVVEGSQPLRISLKCDPQLAKLLREKYESVLPGYHLNKNHWNTILCTGQLDDAEILDLARLSYQLVGGDLTS